jgi:predicted transcriptional regulator
MAHELSTPRPPQQITSRPTYRLTPVILRYTPSMPLKTLTFRVPNDRLNSLNALADLQQRDRISVLNEAVAQYLSPNNYHRRELIEEGIREDDASLSILNETLQQQLATWSSKTNAH